MGQCQAVNNKSEDGHNLQILNTPKSSNDSKKADQYQKELEEETKNSDSKVNMGDIPNIIGQQQPILRKPAPPFTAVGYYQGIKTISMQDYKNQYIVLYFFPFDFSNICHQEIIGFSDKQDEFSKINTSIIGCSVDSQYVHQNYCTKPRSEGGLGGLNIPLMSDVNREISRKYGVIIEDGEGKGASFRSIFIIDRNQILRHSAINDLECAIDVNDTLRIVKAIQSSDKFIPGKSNNMASSNTPQHTSVRQSLNVDNANTPGGQIQGPSVLNYSRRASNAGVAGIQGLRPQNISGNISSGNTRGSISGQPQLPGRQYTSQGSGLEAPEGQRGPKGRKRSILKKRSIFDRMGGELQIRNFVEKLFGYIMEDTRINFFFLYTDLDKIKKQFSNYFISMVGGPENMYKGKELARVHGHLAISLDQFEAFCQILEGTLVESGQDDESIREVFIYVDPMKDFLVSQHTANPLVDRLGGVKIVDKIIEKEFEILKDDVELVKAVEDLDLVKLKQVQKEFFKVALSSQGYNGKNMRDLHKQLNVVGKGFDRILKGLESSLRFFKMEGGAAQEMLILFEPNLQYKHLPKGKAPLYNRIGGSNPEKIFNKLFKLTFQNILNDSRIKQIFKNVDISHVQSQLNHFITLFFGGPLNYQGKTLRDAHWHLELKDSDFDSFKDCFYSAFKELELDQDLIQEADELIEPLRVDIVSIVPSLVERCGGEEVIKRVVDYFYDSALQDKRIKQFFPKSSDVMDLRPKTKDFLIASLGGVNQYQGKSMQEAHAELNLDDVHFNVVKDIFIEGFQKERIALSIVQEVRRVIETFRHLIVNRHSTLYEKVGGDQALVQVVSFLYSGCLNDNQLKMVFKKVDLEVLKIKMQNYLTFLLGGPIEYEGKNLRDAHKSLRISDEQYTAFATHMKQGFLSLGTIDTQTIGEIVVIIEAMRGEIIKRPASLYERLGGEAAIPLCISVFTKKLEKDKKIGGFFEGKIDMQKHSSTLTEFFTMLTGGFSKDGGLAYKGQNLKEVHKGLVLSGGIFDHFCLLLKNTMEEMGAETDEQNEVLNLLESLRTEVIGNKQPTVLDRMGGDRVLNKIVDKFFEKVEDHQTIASYFRKSNMTTLRTKFSTFLSATIGGTQVYEGKGLKEAHWRLNLSNTQFNQFTDLWKISMDEAKVSKPIIKEMMSFWETLRLQIVQRKDEYDDDQESDEDDDEEDEDEED